MDRGIFEDIRSGRKIVETRAATTRFQNIKPGDTAVFVCDQDRFEKGIKRVQIFRNIAGLLNQYKIKDIMPEAADESELMKVYYSFPGYREKIEKFGLVALEFDKN